MKNSPKKRLTVRNCRILTRPIRPAARMNSADIVAVVATVPHTPTRVMLTDVTVQGICATQPVDGTARARPHWQLCLFVHSCYMCSFGIDF
jgi:hypothetical protein